MQPTPVDGLDLLAAGPEVHNPAELLASPRLAELLDEARRTYDVIILDSSPLLAVTDPSILAAVADGIVLVARVSEIRRHDAERTAELLKILKTPVLGTVINGVKPDLRCYGYKLYMASCSSRCRRGTADGRRLRGRMTRRTGSDSLGPSVMVAGAVADGGSRRGV